MKKLGRLLPEHEEFIRRNRKTLSVRQLAATLGVKRADVEEFLRLDRTTSAGGGDEPLSSSKERWWLLCLFVVAMLLRLYYLHALSRTPFFEPLSKSLDDGLYDSRAQSIAAGDWLGRDWAWLIYSVPLYPYFLGVIYWIFGRSLWIAHLIQTALGALTPLLLYYLGKQAFGGRRAPLLAGFIGAVYIPFIFYEGQFLGESVAILLNLCALLLLLRAIKRERGALVAIFSAGLVFGVSVLFRPHVLIALVFPAAYLGFLRASKLKSARQGALSALLLLAGVALAIAPITAKNYYLYHDFVPITSSGGMNLYAGNNPATERGAPPTEMFGSGMKGMSDRAIDIAEKAAGRTLRPSEVSGYWVSRTLHYILGSPLGYCRLMLRKTFFLINRYELCDIRDAGFMALRIPLLMLVSFQYGLVTALVLCGLLIRWRKWNAAQGLLLAFAVGYCAAILLFYVNARYRLPLVPIFILFAAAALVDVWDARRKPEELFKFAALGALAFALVFYPIRRRNFSTDFNALGIYYMDKGRLDEAARYYEESIRINPNSPNPYHNLALIYHHLGDEDKAAAADRRVQELLQLEQANGAQTSGL